MSLTKNTDFQSPLGVDTKPFSSKKITFPSLFLAVGGGKGNIHGYPLHSTLQPPRKEPHALGGVRGSGEFSTPTLLCFWMQPLEDGSDPGHAGNHQDAALEAAQRSHQRQGPKNIHPESNPNRKLEVPSALLGMPSKGRPCGDWKLGFYKGSAPSWSPWDLSGCVLMSCLSYFQISRCPPSNFCAHRMDRAPLSESSSHFHNFPASTIRCPGLCALHGIIISSRKQGLMSQGDGGSPAAQPQSPLRTPWRGFSRQISGNHECQVEAQLCQKYPV